MLVIRWFLDTIDDDHQYWPLACLQLEAKLGHSVEILAVRSHL
jgi:hypothetical protein